MTVNTKPKVARERTEARADRFEEQSRARGAYHGPLRVPQGSPQAWALESAWLLWEPLDSLEVVDAKQRLTLTTTCPRREPHFHLHWCPPPNPGSQPCSCHDQVSADVLLK